MSDVKKNMLTVVQSELHAPKNQYNQFGKYKYRSCEDILEGLKPVLSKYDCGCIVSDSIEIHGERVYMVATATFIDNDGNKTESKGYARESDTKKGMSSEQISGSASSYARKYALNALFLIDDTQEPDDVDNTTEKKAVQGQPVTDINKFLELWPGGKLYNGCNANYKDKIYTLTPDQIEIVKKSQKFKE